MKLDFITCVVCFRPEEYLYLHRLSYWWNVVLSCLLSLFVGLTISLMTLRGGRKGKDTDLFSPLVAAYLRRKTRKNTSKHVIEYSKNKRDNT